MTDMQILLAIPFDHYGAPADIAKRVGLRRINATLGRLARAGLVDRVPGKRSFLYRSKQGRLR